MGTATQFRMVTVVGRCYHDEKYGDHGKHKIECFQQW